jgi:hypothetical protein
MKSQLKNLDFDSLNEYIENELGDWAMNVQRLLQENLIRSNITLTDDLLNSFEEQVYSHASQNIQTLLFGFHDYGRMREMRNLVYTKMPPVEVLEDYVEKVGLAKFKYVPGYRSGKIPHESVAIKRIAWGIARAKFLENRHKPKRWFARAFYREINLLITNLMIGYQEAVANDTTKKLKSFSLGQLAGYDKQRKS